MQVARHQLVDSVGGGGRAFRRCGRAMAPRGDGGDAWSARVSRGVEPRSDRTAGQRSADCCRERAGGRARAAPSRGRCCGIHLPGTVAGDAGGADGDRLGLPVAQLGQPRRGRGAGLRDCAARSLRVPSEAGSRAGAAALPDVSRHPGVAGAAGARGERAGDRGPGPCPPGEPRGPGDGAAIRLGRGPQRRRARPGGGGGADHAAADLRRGGRAGGREPARAPGPAQLRPDRPQHSGQRPGGLREPGPC